MDPHPLRCAISDRNLAGAPDKSGQLSARNRTALLAQAAHLAHAGVDFFQLREKDLSGGTLADLVRDLLQALAGSSTRLLVNGRADVALAAGAAGVHLSGHLEELTPIQINALFARTSLQVPFVSVSCRTLGGVDRLKGSGVDLILFGPVFEKSVAGKVVRAGTGLALLEQASRRAAPLRVAALGGVTAANSGSCVAAGATGLAGIRLFLPSG